MEFYNTDNNNNYGYLEEFNVFRFGASIPLNIPGLSEYIKAYEAKPIAQEVTKASEKRIQKFMFIYVYFF